LTRTGRIIIGSAATVAVIVVLVGVVGLAFFHTFYPSPPAAHLSGASDITTKQREDFDYLQNYFDLNRTFTVESRAHAEQLLAQYRERSGSLSDAQFDLAIAELVAFADNGHSRVEPGPLSRRHNRLPCRFYRFDDGYRIIRARPACAELLGAKVLQLDGRPIEDVTDGMFKYFGGPKNHYDQFAAMFFFESPELLNAAGLAEDANRLVLHVLLADGVERDVTVSADPPDANAPHVYSDEYLSPIPIEKEPPDWKPLLAPDAKLPLFLQNYSTQPFQAEYWPDERIYYAQFRSNMDEPGHPIGEFVTRIEREIAADHPRTIVLDLRLDQGGNFVTTASLMKNLTKLSDSVEHAYVLISAWTFSAGNVSVALVKDHNADKVTLIGEPVGDRIRLWAEGGSLTLPHSGLVIGFATGLHDYSKSCFGESGCFWTMYFFPMHVQSFAPDIRVPYNFDDYVRLRDPVLECARELARRTN
jgi:PAS domain-containing protein